MLPVKRLGFRNLQKLRGRPGESWWRSDSPVPEICPFSSFGGCACRCSNDRKGCEIAKGWFGLVWKIFLCWCNWTRKADVLEAMRACGHSPDAAARHANTAGVTSAKILDIQINLISKIDSGQWHAIRCWSSKTLPRLFGENLWRETHWLLCYRRFYAACGQQMWTQTDFSYTFE